MLFLNRIHKILFLLIIASLVAGQFWRIELYSGIAIYWHELAMCFYVVISLLSFPFIKNLKSTTIRVLMLVNVYIYFNVWLNSDTLSSISSILYLLRLDLYLLFALSFWQDIKHKLLSTNELSRCLTISFIGISLVGWLQYLFFPDTRSLVLIGWDDHYLRLIGTIFDPGFLGAILAIGSIFSLQQNGKLANLAFWLTTSALLFTYSRASYLAFLAGIIILFVKQRKWHHLGVAIIFVAAILFLPRPASEGTRLERTASISARVESVGRGIERRSIKESIFGRGWYHLKTAASHASAPDNSYIFIYDSLGMIGVAIFAYAFRLLIKQQYLFPIFGVIGVHAMFSNTLFYPFIMLLLGIFIADRSLFAPQSSRSQLYQQPEY